MGRLNGMFRERLKSYLFILLIITSMIQVGILWSYQSQGLPFNFLSGFFTNSDSVSADDANNLKNFFVPYQMIVSGGYDQPRWLLDRSDNNYNSLWNEAIYYLKKLLKSQYDEQFPLSKWNNLISNKKGFIFEFKTNIKMNLLEKFLGTTGISSNKLTGVYKIMISPWDDASATYNSNTIYICDDSGVYKYNTILNQNGIKDKDLYDAIIVQLEGYDGSANYRFVSQYSAIFGNKLNAFSGDMLCSIGVSGIRKFNGIKCSAPEGFGVKGTTGDEKVAEKILGADKDSYDRSGDEKNTLEFKTINNIYKVFPNGYMEYNYLPIPSEADKGEMKEAFKKSFEFIHKMGLQTDITKLYLSRIKEISPTDYEFDFDYMVDGVPVFTNFESKTGDPLHNAIVIRASSKNVLSCRAMLKSFQKKVESSKSYNVDFINGFLNLAYIKTFLKTNKDATGINVAISYEIDSSEGEKDLKPVWVVQAAGKYYTVPVG